jgi:hypothetical protein
MDNKLQKVQNYFTQREGWSLQELIEETVYETDMLKWVKLNLSIDELSIYWGDDNIVGLDDFLNSYTKLLINKFCNVVKSFDE